MLDSFGLQRKCFLLHENKELNSSIHHRGKIWNFLVGTRKSNSFLSSFMSHVSFLATEYHPLGVFHLSLTWVFTSYSVLKAMRKWKWFTTFRKRQLGFGESRSQFIWKLETLPSDKSPQNVDWWGSFDTYFTGIYRSATPNLASPSATVKSTQVTVRFLDDGL